MKAIKFDKKYIRLILLMIWIGFIFMFSSQSYSEQSIQPLLKEHIPKETVSNLVPNVTIHYGDGLIPAKENPYTFIEFLFRKSSHLFMYAGLGLFCCMTLYRWIRKRTSALYLSIIVAGVIAVLDEYNQYLNPGRTGMIQDVLLDLVGASLGIILYLSYNIYRARRSRP